MVDLDIDVEKYKEWLFTTSIKIAAFKGLDTKFLIDNWDSLNVEEWEQLYREFETKEIKERLDYWIPTGEEVAFIEASIESVIGNERAEFEKKCLRSSLPREKLAERELDTLEYRFDSFYTNGAAIPLKLLKISRETALIYFYNDLANYHTAVFLKRIIDGLGGVDDSIVTIQADEETCFRSKKHLEAFTNWLVNKRLITNDLNISKGRIKPNSWVYGFVAYARSLKYVSPGTTIQECYDELAKRFKVAEPNTNKLTKGVKGVMEGAKHALPDYSKL